MTIKQAVSWLSQPGILAMIHDQTTKKAVQVAIKALSANDTNVGTKLGTNLAEVGTDSISRQQAIDALRDYLVGKNVPCDGTLTCRLIENEVISKLPSAQPEPCEDAVSRETLLKFFDGWMSALDENCHNQSVSDFKIIKRDFANLPSVTPKQRTGKWIKLDMHRGMADHKCTACEQECYVPTCMGEPLYAFCPMCGAKMEGADDE